MDSISPPMPPNASSGSPFSPPSSPATNSEKDSPQTFLYLHGLPMLQIIQLIEVCPPPPGSHCYSPTISSKSFASCSCHSSCNGLEEYESICSSYCSSEGVLGEAQALTNDDTYTTRLQRVLAWRDKFEREMVADNCEEETSVTLPAQPSSPISSGLPLKRKADFESFWEPDDEYTSKRPRLLPIASRQVSDHVSNPPPKQRRPGLYPCTACDTNFYTMTRLQQHGKQLGIKRACREAVAYRLES